MCERERERERKKDREAALPDNPTYNSIIQFLALSCERTRIIMRTEIMLASFKKVLIRLLHLAPNKSEDIRVVTCCH